MTTIRNADGNSRLCIDVKLGSMFSKVIESKNLYIVAEPHCFISTNSGWFPRINQRRRHIIGKNMNSIVTKQSATYCRKCKKKQLKTRTNRTSHMPPRNVRQFFFENEVKVLIIIYSENINQWENSVLHTKKCKYQESSIEIPEKPILIWAT